LFDVVYVTRAVDYPLFDLSLRTLLRNLRGRGALYLVVPDADVTFFVSQPLVTVAEARVVPERDLLPAIPDARARWFKQQLLKLCIHRVIRADAALVLDSDVLVARPVEAASFLVDGRAKLFVEDWEGRAHMDWVAAAERFLGQPRRGRPTFFPTPNFVTRLALTALHDYVGVRHRRDGMQVLVDALGSYTEWQTYGLFVERIFGEAQAGHILTDEAHVHGVWQPSDWDRFLPAPGHRLERPFLVVQSLLRLEPADIVARLAEVPDLSFLAEQARGSHPAAR
jgi:Family of unknown function (DUF6492)